MFSQSGLEQKRLYYKSFAKLCPANNAAKQALNVEPLRIMVKVLSGLSKSFQQKVELLPKKSTYKIKPFSEAMNEWVLLKWATRSSHIIFSLKMMMAVQGVIAMKEDYETGLLHKRLKREPRQVKEDYGT